MSRYVAATTLPVSAAQAFSYHERPGALKRLLPPWEQATIVRSDNSLAPGSRVNLKASLGPVPIRWIAEHVDFDPPNYFSDRQVSGPFRFWHHRHRFVPSSAESSVMEDRIDYEIPLGAAGKLFGSGAVTRRLESMFAYRHRVTREDLTLLDRYGDQSLRIAISGASGLIGQQLINLLTLLGHQVIRLERSLEKIRSVGEGASSGEAAAHIQSIAPWESDSEAAKLEGIDAVIHLAGKPIAGQRWSDEIKRQIRESRISLTRELAEKLAGLEVKPKVFICASAVGIYGDRGDEKLVEDAAIGSGFLSEVAHQWEQACGPAAEAGIRVVNARFGLVLDPRGGALEQMLFPARMFGGALGSGRQWWSPISLDDALGAIYHLICTEMVEGPVNLTIPEPIQNRDFAKVLGRVLSRPAIFPAPAFALRAALGEMADALLLASHRVLPVKLIDSGYEFRFSESESILRYCLGKNRLESME